MAPSSSRGRVARGVYMDSAAIPMALKDRLGPEATDGPLQLMDRLETDLREDVITACTERFERRPVEETSTLRVQIAQVESSIRQDMTRLGSELRQEMGALGSELRQEIGAVRSDLRQEMGALGSQMASDRFDLLKWAFPLLDRPGRRDRHAHRRHDADDRPGIDAAVSRGAGPRPAGSATRGARAPPPRARPRRAS